MLLLIFFAFPVLITAGEVSEVSIQFEGEDEPAAYKVWTSTEKKCPPDTHTVNNFKLVKDLYDEVGSDGIIPLAHVTKKQFDILVNWRNVSGEMDATFKSMQPFELLTVANYLDAPSDSKDCIAAYDADVIKSKTPIIIREHGKTLFAGLPNELDIYVAKYQLHDVLKNLNVLKCDLVEKKTYDRYNGIARAAVLMSNRTERGFVVMYTVREMPEMEYISVDFADNNHILQPKRFRIYNFNIDEDSRCAISSDGRYLLTMAKGLAGWSRAYLKDTTEDESEFPLASLLEENAIKPKDMLAALFNSRTNKFNVIAIKNTRGDTNLFGGKLCFFEIDPALEPLDSKKTPDKTLNVKKTDEFDLDIMKNMFFSNISARNVNWSCIDGNIVGVVGVEITIDKRACFMYAKNQLIYCFQKEDGTMWTETEGEEDRPFDAPFSTVTLHGLPLQKNTFVIEKSFIPQVKELVVKDFPSAFSSISFDVAHMCIQQVDGTSHEISLHHIYPPALMADKISLDKQVQLGRATNLLAQAFVFNRRWLNPGGWREQCKHILAAKLPEIEKLQSIKEITYDHS